MFINDNNKLELREILLDLQTLALLHAEETRKEEIELSTVKSDGLRKSEAAFFAQRLSQPKQHIAYVAQLYKAAKTLT